MTIFDNIGETEGEIGGHILCAIDMPSLRCLYFLFFYLIFNVQWGTEMCNV